MAAFAGDLDGLWGSLGSRHYGFAITESYGGRVSIRDASGIVARGHRYGDRINLRSTDGSSTPWNGMITSRQRGTAAEIQMSDGSVLRRLGGLPAFRSVDPPEFARRGATQQPALPEPFPQPQPAPQPFPYPPQSEQEPEPYPAPAPGPEPEPWPEQEYESVAFIAGTYVSNPLNLTYRITQSGNSFHWTIDGLAQQGQGTIDGGRVQASWQGPLVRGSSGGTIVSGANGVTALRFDNGMTLLLQQP